MLTKVVYTYSVLHQTFNVLPKSQDCTDVLGHFRLCNSVPSAFAQNHEFGFSFDTIGAQPY
jgi:hypothetical protein